VLCQGNPIPAQGGNDVPILGGNDVLFNLVIPGLTGDLVEARQSGIAGGVLGSTRFPLKAGMTCLF